MIFTLISSALGIFVLLRGQFRLADRQITTQKGRAIGMILIAPILGIFCLSAVVAQNYITVNEVDGTVDITEDALMEMSNSLVTADFVLAAFAIALAAYNIFSLPKGDAPLTVPSQPRRVDSAPPAEMPRILTVAEVAAYLRVSETQVLNLIETGKLGAVRIGDTYRIAKIAVDDFMTRKEED